MRRLPLVVLMLLTACDGRSLTPLDATFADAAWIDAGAADSGTADDAGPPCVDEDGDGYGDGCEAGPDCDDRDDSVNPGAAAACGGVDVDCDSAIDEGCDCASGETRVCGQSTGACMQGEQRCADEVWSACEGAVAAAAELCDGALDEDCDGTVDEGCDCVDGQSRACGSALGACRLGTETCVFGSWGACEGGTSAGTESCDGSVDEDCDGTVDEGCSCSTGTIRDCGTDVGVCVRGTETCTAGTWDTCSATLPGTEVCDGVSDENCDGTVDEGCACANGATRVCGTDDGVCEAGTETCTEGAWDTCVGATDPGLEEACDGVEDEDCDGTVDEGCTSDDPFDPGSCNGIAWTGVEAAARLGGMSREVLGSATIQFRTRSCPGGTCGDWGDPADWYINYLTWSGGVSTRYKRVRIDTNVVLFDDGGTPSLSLQHVTFAAGGYDDDMGMVYGFPPNPISYPHVRAYNVGVTGYDYEDLDYQVKNGVLVIGDGCARWTADPFGASTPYTTQYAVLYRW